MTMPDQTGTVQTPPAPTTTPNGQQAQPPAPPAPAPNAGTTTTDAGATQQVDVAALQAENARLAKEAADARVSAKAKVAADAQRAQLLAFAQAIGIELPQGDDNSPEALQAKLQAEVEGRQTDQTALATERQNTAIELAAFKHGIDEAKQGYLNFLLKGNPEFTNLDSKDPNYKTSVASLVETIKAADPFFAATPGGAARSGGEVLGGAGNPGEVSQDTFNSWGVMERTALFQKNPELYRRLEAGRSGS